MPGGVRVCATVGEGRGKREEVSHKEHREHKAFVNFVIFVAKTKS